MQIRLNSINVIPVFPGYDMITNIHTVYGKNAKVECKKVTLQWSCNHNMVIVTSRQQRLF